MKSTRVLLGMALAILMVAGFTSCKKPVPVAKFSFTVSGKTVTFVNESTDALTYAWTFGDNTTSTEQSPVHTFGDYGLYSVSLKATGEGGDNTATNDVELVFTPSMVINGDFAKWNSVPDFVAGAGGTMTKVKLSHDEKYLYIYVEGSATFRGFLDIYILKFRRSNPA